MKGNASCHIPNAKYRDSYDDIFKKKLKHEWITANGVDICQCCGVSKSSATSNCDSKIKITNYNGKLKVTNRVGDSNEK